MPPPKPGQGRGRGGRPSARVTPHKALPQTDASTATPSGSLSATRDVPATSTATISTPNSWKRASRRQSAFEITPSKLSLGRLAPQSQASKSSVGRSKSLTSGSGTTPKKKAPSKRSLIVRLKLPAAYLCGGLTSEVSQKGGIGTENFRDALIADDIRTSRSTSATSEELHSFAQESSTGPTNNGKLTMAPVSGRDGFRGRDDVEVALKNTVQDLFDIQAMTLGYVEGTDVELIRKIETLTTSLQDLRSLVANQSHAETDTRNLSASSDTLPLIPREIIDYVDEGRNPDIYTREFVESILRYNQNLAGKRKAFADFGDILAAEMKKKIPGISAEVDRIMQNRDEALKGEGGL